MVAGAEEALETALSEKQEAEDARAAAETLKSDLEKELAETKARQEESETARAEAEKRLADADGRMKEALAGRNIAPEKKDAGTADDMSAAGPRTAAEFHEQFNAIDDPRTRGEFYRKHADACLGERA